MAPDVAPDIILAVIVEIVAALVLTVLSWAASTRWQSPLSLGQVWTLIGGTVVLTSLIVAVTTVGEMFGAVKGTYALVQQRNPPIPTPIPPSPTLAYAVIVSSTATPTPTATQQPTDTPTPTPTETPAETLSPTPTVSSTATPTFTPSETPTAEPSPTPTPTSSPTPSATPLPAIAIIWRDSLCDRSGQQATITQVRVEGDYLVIEGIANIALFDRYSLYWGTGPDLNKPVEERTGFESKTPVPPPGGKLHRIQLSTFPPGEYRFTLRVVRQDANYDTCEVGIIRR